MTVFVPRLLLPLLLVLLAVALVVEAPVPPNARATATAATAAPESPKPWNVRYTTGFYILLVHLLSTLPWTVITIFDAIDASYRTSQQVALRLSLCTFFLLLAYATGIGFVAALVVGERARPSPAPGAMQHGRHDEIATILVLLIFNIWHVARNTRGWLQFFALRRLHTPFVTLQRRFARSFPTDPHHPPTTSAVAVGARADDPLLQGLLRLRISSRLIDNDFSATTPFLSPFRPRQRSAFSADTALNDPWAVALWRAWWTQDTKMPPAGKTDLAVDESALPVGREHLASLALDLLRSNPSGLQPRPVTDGGPPVAPLVTDQRPNADPIVIKTKHQWAAALEHYGSSPGRAPGQQDSIGYQLPARMSTRDASAIAIAVREKTTVPPNRMSLLWYDTARFDDVYRDLAFRAPPPGAEHTPDDDVKFPTLAEWQSMAADIGTHLDLPFNLTDKLVTVFAGELAAASVLLVRFPDKLRQLVERVHEDGLNARWTFGWSGLLACFSDLWTLERVYIAMLNGLSLLVLARYNDVNSIDPNVRAMMYGYAAFAVSERAVGKRVAEERNRELLYRYRQNKGKTCRGSGLHATRIACKLLGLPQEASHMDGMPAFSTGWASEFMERLPGNQEPQHGRTHEEAEKREGSAQMWRYPHSCG